MDALSYYRTGFQCLRLAQLLIASCYLLHFLKTRYQERQERRQWHHYWTHHQPRTTAQGERTQDDAGDGVSGREGEGGRGKGEGERGKGKGGRGLPYTNGNFVLRLGMI